MGQITLEELMAATPGWEDRLIDAELSLERWQSRESEGALTEAWSINIAELVIGMASLPPYLVPEPFESSSRDRAMEVTALLREAAALQGKDAEVPFYLDGGPGGNGEVFLPTVVGDTVIYARFECRLTDVPSQEAINRLQRRFDKKHRLGQGEQEHIALELAHILTMCGGAIPYGINREMQLFDPLASPLSRVIERDMLSMKAALVKSGADEATQDKWLPQFLYKRFIAYLTLTESDTPLWVCPTEDLALMLANTDTKGLLGADVQAPARVVHVKLPLGLFGTHASGDNPRCVTSLSLTIEPNNNGSRSLSSLALLDDMPPYRGGPHLSSGLPQSLSFSFFDEQELGLKSLREIVGEAKYKEETFTYKVAGRPLDSAEFSVLLFNFCVNVLMYISSHTSDCIKSRRSLGAIKERGKGKKKKRKRPLSEVEEWVIGTEVKLDKSSRESFRKGASSTISYAFLVRGHWRDQAHGPNRSLRKRIWIRPFVKGKDLGKRVLGHTYKDGKG